MGSTKDRIIDAATERFYADGFHAVGLDRILDAVGVTKTTFYNHFESKDNLIIEALNRRDRIETEELLAAVRARSADPRERFLAVFDAMFEWFTQPDFRGCIFMNAAVAYPAPNDPIHKAAAAHGESLHRELRELAVATGVTDPDQLAGQAMVLISGALAARHVSDDASAALIARGIAEKLLDAALAPSAATGA